MTTHPPRSLVRLGGNTSAYSDALALGRPCHTGLLSSIYGPLVLAPGGREPFVPSFFFFFYFF